MLINDRAACFTFSMLLLLILYPASAAKTIYVDDDATGANNGTNWDDAYTFLQEALNDAELAEKPVEIRVAQGIYRPNGGLVAIPEFDWRTTTFQLINGVALQGGYAGLSEPDPDARDIDLYETILSGDLNGDDGPNFANNSENSYHVVTGSDTDETAILDGFTIIAGNANIIVNEDLTDYICSCGGGMFNASGSPTLKNCEFRTNSAYWNGGGMYNSTSNPTLTNCVFNGNLATSEDEDLGNGGGMYNVYGSNPILTGCVFVGNFANWCSGIGNSWDSNPKVTNCTFTGNRSKWSRGWVIWSWDSSPILINCILWNNTLPQIVGNANISYSNVQGGHEGEGNIDADPIFADPDNGDYHLKSEVGRWDAVSESWVVDDVTSPCIDAGDPDSPVAFEPFPNGGIVNMGAYGGTAQASKSPSGLHAKYGGGAGEPNKPYLIYTPEHMNTIGLHPEDQDSHFKLMADIDLRGLGTREFNIIGTFPNYFRGVFDGNGRTISNFTYISTDVAGVALFSYVEGDQAEIRDLGLIDPVVNAGMVNPNVNQGKGNRAGSLVDNLRLGTVSRCYVRGGSVSGDLHVGGLVAYSHKGVLTDCYSITDVAGIQDVGGLVGYNNGTVTRCRAISNVTGELYVGGAVGYSRGTIRDSSGSGDVTGDGSVGGLVGWSDKFGTVQGSFSTSNVSGGQYVGGLAGRSYGDVTNCYSTSRVSGGRYVGGLVGFFSGLVMDCYSAGSIVHEPIEGFEGDSRIGGLAGSGHSPDDVLASFWDIETSGWTISFAGTGLTTAEMQTAKTFIEAGWDFINETENGIDDIWWIAEGQDYPRLWWEMISEN